MNTSLSKSLRAFIGLSLLTSTVLAHRSTSRHFTFLDRPEEYNSVKKSSATASMLFIDAAHAEGRDGKAIGIPTLWGQYDLSKIMQSANAVNPGSVHALAEEVQDLTRATSYKDTVLLYNTNSSVSVRGAKLHYEQYLYWGGLYVGASLPIVSMRSTFNAGFKQDGSSGLVTRSTVGSFAAGMSDADVAQAALATEKQNLQLRLDAVRRQLHDLIGFEKNDSLDNGFGDLDMYARWNNSWDYKLLMKNISINLMFGATAPTGMKRDQALPMKVPFGNNGHWSVYGDFLGVFTLKQDWTLGLIFEFAQVLEHTQKQRLAVGSEPDIFSALSADVRTNPGFSFKFSPYFTIGNLADGLDFQLRYSFLKHTKDAYADMRTDKTIPSYFTSPKKDEIIASKRDLSKWTAHYITFMVTYDPARAASQYKFAPTLFISYDMPMNGNGYTVVHTVAAGAEWRF
jgi:hypothetical protein